MNILLVEDNAGDARLIEEKLARAALAQSAGHDAFAGAIEAVVVARLADALGWVAEHAPDVVLLDLALPDAGGLEAVTRLVAAAPEIAVVVLTATADEALATQAVREGAQDYLVKGEVDGATLLRTLRYAFERKRAENSSKRLVEEQTARGKVEAAERRARFLAEASRVLASSLDYEATLASVARLAVPILADDCFVDMLADGAFRRVASAHASPARSSLPPRDGETELARRAMRTGEPLLIVEGIGATLFVPLVARGLTLGSITLSATGARRYERDEIDLAVELAGRAALAADNARLYHEAREATRARDEVIAIVSHDLRNPLNVMTMTMGLLTEDHGMSEDKRKKHLQKLERATSRMISLIDELLDVSRMDGKGLVVHAELAHATTLVDEAIAAISALHTEKSTEKTMRVRAAVAQGLMVYADAARIVQVVTSLVSQAIMLSPGDADLTVEAKGTSEGVRFAVSAPGAMLEADEITRVYDRFWSKRNGGHEGAGLGLAIAKAVVEAHRGEVWATSDAAGTTFHFTLPHQKPSPT